MPIPKLNITNPQALELIRKIQSREIFIPIITWLKNINGILFLLSLSLF